jgi:GH24 family phage-related lysozyme (muramidase)
VTPQEWNDDFAERLIHNEGFRLRMYLDTMSVPTIGCGFNLTRDDWQTGLIAAGVPAQLCDSVKAGNTALTVAEVQALLSYSDEPIIPQARARLQATHFDNMSDARRCAFADMDFNLGVDGLDQFIGFRGLMDQACHYMQTGDPIRGHAYFVSAANDLLSTAYAAQVGARAKRNASMIASSVYCAIDAFEGG